MNDKLMDCFSHPVMCKLFLEIYGRKSATAKELAAAYPDIPQTTLYRYLKQMAHDGIIKVAKEIPIRGTVEKTYALAVDLESSVESIILSNDGEAYMMLFMQYISSFVTAFQAYSRKRNIDLRKDLGTFATAPIYASDDELVDALNQIGEIITSLVKNAPSQERKARNMGFIVTPPLEVE